MYKKTYSGNSLCELLKYQKDSNKIWLIDIDGTLYKKESMIINTIEQRYIQYLSYKFHCSINEAKELNNDLLKEFGNTIQGVLHKSLINKKDVQELFMYIHAIELNSNIIPNKRLINFIEKVEGKIVIFSNGPRFHVNKILKYINFIRNVDMVYTFEDLMPYCKPNKEAFFLVKNALHSNFENMILLDDSLNVIKTGRALNLITYQIK